MSSARLPVLEKFIGDLRAIWAAEPDNQRRMEHGQAAARRVRDGAGAEGAFGELAVDRGRTRTCCSMSIPTIDFVVNAVVRVPGRTGSVHDHADAWVLYGMLDGTESLERYDRLDDGSKPGYAEVKLASVTTGTQGKVDLVPPRNIHAEQGGPTRSVAIIVRSQKLGAGHGAAGPLRPQDQRADRGLRADAGALRPGGVPAARLGINPRYWAQGRRSRLALGARPAICYRQPFRETVPRLPAIAACRRLARGEGRCPRPIPSMQNPKHSSMFSATLAETDPEIAEAVRRELGRQRDEIELIASENIVSNAVLEAQGSVLTNKYAEGLPGRRYYGGCQYVDIAETLAIERVTKLFGCRFANVQPHSGASANAAAFMALMPPGDTFLGLNLAAGGHLTHGSPVNMSGKWFKPVPYGVRRDDHRIDMDEVQKLAREHRPKVIIAGGSAYPRIIDFRRFREIADEVGAYPHGRHGAFRRPRRRRRASDRRSRMRMW